MERWEESVEQRILSAERAILQRIAKDKATPPNKKGRVAAGTNLGALRDVHEVARTRRD